MCLPFIAGIHDNKMQRRIPRILPCGHFTAREFDWSIYDGGHHVRIKTAAFCILVVFFAAARQSEYFSRRRRMQQ